MKTFLYKEINHNKTHLKKIIAIMKEELRLSEESPENVLEILSKKNKYYFLINEKYQKIEDREERLLKQREIINQLKKDIENFEGIQETKEETRKKQKQIDKTKQNILKKFQTTETPTQQEKKEIKEILLKFSNEDNYTEKTFKLFNEYRKQKGKTEIEDTDKNKKTLKNLEELLKTKKRVLKNQIVNKSILFKLPHASEANLTNQEIMEIAVKFTEEMYGKNKINYISIHHDEPKIDLLKKEIGDDIHIQININTYDTKTNEFNTIDKEIEKISQIYNKPLNKAYYKSYKEFGELKQDYFYKFSNEILKNYDKKIEKKEYESEEEKKADRKKIKEDTKKKMEDRKFNGRNYFNEQKENFFNELKNKIEEIKKIKPFLGFFGKKQKEEEIKEKQKTILKNVNNYFDNFIENILHTKEKEKTIKEIKKEEEILEKQIEKTKQKEKELEKELEKFEEKNKKIDTLEEGFSYYKQKCEELEKTLLKNKETIKKYKEKYEEKEKDTKIRMR